MNCVEFEAALQPYTDGEMPLRARLAADAHLAICLPCAELVQRERDFRRLVRRQPRETAPADLRTKLASLLRPMQRARRRRPWPVMAGLAISALALVVAAGVLAPRRAPSLVTDMVDKHVAYAQIEHPVELASSDRDEVEQWFRERAGLGVPVPDFSRAGIRLLGARVTDARDRVAAYLLYEKGRTLMSLFVVPGLANVGPDEPPAKDQVSGFHTVSWRAGGTFFALVSSLDHDALQACADALRIAGEARDDPPER